MSPRQTLDGSTRYAGLMGETTGKGAGGGGSAVQLIPE